MKKNLVILSAILTCVISMFTSCVQSDMYELYDEDGTECFSPRRKGTKDNGPQQLPGTVYNTPYYHRIVKAIPTGCGARSLDSKFPGQWREKVVQSTQARYAEIAETDPDYLPTFVQKYYTNGSVDVDKVVGGAMEYGVVQQIITACGGNGSGAAGYICHISHYNHYVHIVGVGSGQESSYYVDMDGNVWAGEMLSKM